MKVKNNVVRTLLLLALLVIPTGSVFAQTPGGDIVLFGQNYTVESGDTVNGAIAVFGGNVDVEEDGTVKGDMAVIGGNLSIDGDINGNIAIIGGNLTLNGTVNGEIVVIGGQVVLEETAVVDGNIASIGGNVEKRPGAEVTGDITNNVPPTINVPDVPNPPEVPGVPNTPNINVEVNPFWNVAGKVGQAIGIALIAMLLALFLQPQLERTGDAITRQPLMAGGYGLLTVILVPAVILVLTITIILIPIAAIVFLALPLAWLFGMIALGQEVGNRFTKAIDQTWAPVLTIGFGTFLLMLVAGLLQLVPCFGFLSYMLLSFVAIGAAAATLFGTRNMPGVVSNSTAIDSSPSDS